MCGQVLIMVDHEIYTRLGSVQAAETYARQFMNSVNFRSDTTQGIPQKMPLCLATALQQRSILWDTIYRKAMICLKIINNMCRYSLIKKPKVEFSLTGIYVATNPGDIPFLVSSSGGFVTSHIDSSTVLSRMGSHFNKER